MVSEFTTDAYWTNCLKMIKKKLAKDAYRTQNVSIPPKSTKHFIPKLYI